MEAAGRGGQDEDSSQRKKANMYAGQNVSLAGSGLSTACLNIGCVGCLDVPLQRHSLQGYNFFVVLEASCSITKIELKPTVLGDLLDFGK